MNKNKNKNKTKLDKSKLFGRIMAFLLAAMMVLSMGAVVIYYILDL